MIKYKSSIILFSIQEKFNFLEPTARATLFPLAQDKDLSIIAYSPLAMGLLGGRVSETRQFAQGDIRRTSRRFAPDQLALLGPLITRLTSLARECGFTLSQLAIAWVLSHREVSHVLLGARQPQQIRENAARIDAVISDDVVLEINRMVEKYEAQLPPLF